jgi:hypothetical protein
MLCKRPMVWQGVIRPVREAGRPLRRTLTSSQIRMACLVGPGSSREPRTSAYSARGVSSIVRRSWKLGLHLADLAVVVRHLCRLSWRLRMSEASGRLRHSDRRWPCRLWPGRGYNGRHVQFLDRDQTGILRYFESRTEKALAYSRCPSAHLDEAASKETWRYE